MKLRLLLLLGFGLFIFACQNEGETSNQTEENTTQESASSDEAALKEAKLNAEGVKMIPVETPEGTFNVYTRKVGENPDVKVLLLHGGPGCTHELYESIEQYFPGKSYEFYYYDQLGSYHSDQPSDTSLWNIERFVDEVEQVRTALGLNKDNFYLLGQSWGGILAMEYAFRHQENLKGLIISNMMSNVEAYNKYNKEVLAPALPKDVLDTIMYYEDREEYGNETYLSTIEEHYYTRHVLRSPIEEWPDAIVRTFTHLNPEVYVYMQGPSEFGLKGDATLKDWDVSQQLSSITVPTLTVGGTHDTMDPDHMEWMAKQIPNSSFLLCPNGSHLSQYDDMDNYWNGIITFIEVVESGVM